MHAVLQVPAFREGIIRPGAYAATLEAIAAQPAPSDWTLDREVWVTLDEPDDPTWEIPASMPEFDVLEGPAGKLSTRNAAHDNAVARGADAFVVWDADTTPRTNEVLGSILNSLAEPRVAAVNSRTRAEATFLGRGWDLISGLFETFVPFLHGQCHGMTAEAWEHAGPFDESIDQMDIHTVWMEEEYGFYRRLEEVGEIAHPVDVVVESDTRRLDCRIDRAWNLLDGRPLDQWCGERGEKSFAPSHPTRSYGSQTERRRGPAAPPGSGRGRPPGGDAGAGGYHARDPPGDHRR